MPGFQKIQYKGKEILYVDYRDSSEEQMIETAKALKNHLLAENRPHLRLVNITDAYAKPRFSKFIRQLGEDTKHIPFKGAIVGITGGKKALLMIYNKILGGAIRPFDTEEEAKEYLIN